MNYNELLEQELAELNARIKEVGKKHFQHQLRKTWERACKQMLQSISDGFEKNKDNSPLEKMEYLAFKELYKTIQNFPIPEYREAEQKETE